MPMKVWFAMEQAAAIRGLTMSAMVEEASRYYLLRNRAE